MQRSTSLVLTREELLALEECLELSKFLAQMTGGELRLASLRLQLRLIWALCRLSGPSSDLSRYQKERQNLLQALNLHHNPSQNLEQSLHQAQVLNRI